MPSGDCAFLQWSPVDKLGLEYIPFSTHMIVVCGSGILQCSLLSMSGQGKVAFRPNLFTKCEKRKAESSCIS